MARPLWSGTIQISLVGFAVEVYPATSTTRPISFHEIDRNTLGRVRRENVSAGHLPKNRQRRKHLKKPKPPQRNVARRCTLPRKPETWVHGRRGSPSSTRWSGPTS